MKGFLCVTNAKNDEEYRAVVKKRNLYFSLAAVLGIAMTIISTWAYSRDMTDMTDISLGFFSGAGIGIAIVCVLQIILNLRLLRDDKKLHSSRVACSDERLVAIESKARNTALAVLSLVFVSGCLIGGIFYPVLIKIIGIAAAVFAVTYALSYLIYSKKM